MDRDKIPTQMTASRAGHVRCGTQGHLAITSSAARIALPGSGLLRKSASSMGLKEAQSAADNIPTGPLAALDRPASAMFKPRADRGTEVTVHNAQGIWPAEAVVFVANLSTRRSLEQLEHACHDLFGVFGRNVIKVKFDRNKHPFALVQFETTEAAVEALTSNQGAVIDGRPIRLEQGKAERAVVIARKDGTEMREGEARAVLEPYGALDALFPTYSVCGSMTDLPGFSARFVYYQDCQDALHALSGVGSVFRLQLATGREQDARLMSTAVSQTGVITTAPRPRGGQHGARRDIDSKSIFVGNLPHGTTNDDLINLFREHGTVIDCNVVNKVYEGISFNTFGFVEFASCAEAEAAAYTNKYLAGCKLRVEPKEYTSRRGKRLGRPGNSSMVTPARSPRHTPRRIAPPVTSALGARLAANNLENWAANMTPMPTPPSHLLPAHLFSPSPPGVMWPVGYYDAGTAQAYNQFGMRGGWPVM
ncbi:hypothetical protein DV736_g5941, partial [Chaetothyriales sp. CBS 134916]